MANVTTIHASTNKTVKANRDYKAVLLHIKFVDAIKAQIAKSGNKEQTVTDFVKMTVARKINFDVTTLPVSKRGKERQYPTSAEIAAMIAKGDVTGAQAALALLQTRDAKVKESREAAKSRKASPVKSTMVASFDDFGMPIAI